MFYRLFTLLLLVVLVGCAQDDIPSDEQTLTYGSIDLHQAARYNLQLGLGYLEQGDVERAKGKFLKALKQAPKLPETLYNIAHFYYLIDELELADEYFNSAIKYASKNTKGVLGTARNNYGVFLCQVKKYQQAEYQFKQAVADKNYADTASAYENAGLCALKDNNKVKAEQYFKKAISQNPLTPKALLEISDIYLQDHEYTKSLFYLERYHQVAGKNKRSLLIELGLASAFGEVDKIESLSKMLVEKYPSIQDTTQLMNNQVEKYSKIDKSFYNDKLVKYTDIGELSTISSRALS